MTETTLQPGDVERLASALEPLCVDFDAKDRATLHAIFALAGKSAAGEAEDEVSGFALPGTLFDSFQWGVGRGTDADALNPQPLPP